MLVASSQPNSKSTPAATGLLRRVIPCLDVAGGRIVKGVRFAGLRDAGDPVERAAKYARDGADEIVMLDVSATPEQRATSVETVERVRSVLDIPITVGGGVRSDEDAARLLSAGADKVAVNSAAVRDPRLLTRLAQRFGRQCVVLSLDATRRLPKKWAVVVRSGTNTTAIDALDWATQATALGAGEVLLTSFDRDGTRCGYDLALLRAVSSRVNVPVIASGGAATPAHLVDAFGAGACAALAASLFHDDDYTVSEVKSCLRQAGVGVRS